MEYYHVNVFAEQPLNGNGLSVLIDSTFPPEFIMQRIAKELKQYETIFLCKRTDAEYDARIYTVEEELFFAGHPILGAAAVLREKFPEWDTIRFHLREKEVRVRTERKKDGRTCYCQMDQGRAKVLRTIRQEEEAGLLEPLHLSKEDRFDILPLEVVSTGLPYLIVPIQKGIEKTGIYSLDYEERLRNYGAKFVYIIDINTLEGRSFDNGGIEDVATGSAAGPVGDHLIRHKICTSKEEIILKQGRFLDRPSQIYVKMDSNRHILVSGSVQILGRGVFTL